MRTLLIIDLQKQFKDDKGNYQKCLEYIENNRSSYDRIVATVFSQKVKFNPNFKNKLKWNGCMGINTESLDFDLTGIDVVIKHGYSFNAGDFFDRSDTIDVIGCDADACVLAVCFELWDAGIDFRILEDYIYTTADYPKDIVLQIMKRNFGSCVQKDIPENTEVQTTTRSAISKFTSGFYNKTKKKKNL